MDDTLGFLVLRVFLAVCAISLFVVWYSTFQPVPIWLTALNKLLILPFYPILAILLAWVCVVIRPSQDAVDVPPGFQLMRVVVGLSAVSVFVVWLSLFMALWLWVTVLNTMWIFPFYLILVIRLAHLALAWKPKPPSNVDTWFLP
jgi:hypothetical protein